MCGITTLVRRDGDIDRELLRQLTWLLHHRGPDEEGFYFEDRVALGHQRLSIIDLKSGRQPLFNEDGTIGIVFNGEIYDYRNHKAALEDKGHLFKTQADTEVLVHLFEEYNYRLSEHIEGMFAFSIYDKRNKTVTISRDHFGKKPIFFYLDDLIFAVASEVKALLKIPEILSNISIDHGSLTKYLFYGYIPSPYTIFDKIRKLEPSTTMQFKIDEWQVVRKYNYWDLLREGMISEDVCEEEILDRLDHLITEAVKKRLMADVPLGAFLSGGVDSSLMCAVAKKLKQDLQTFTVSYSYREIDESDYAKAVAGHIGAKSNLCNFGKDDVVDTFKEVLDFMDEPVADAAIIPTYFISKFAAKHVKVVLSGDGGDELFGGYPKYNAQIVAERIHNVLPRSAISMIDRIGSPILRAMPLTGGKRDNLTKFISTMKYDFSARNFLWGSGSFLPEEIVQLLDLDNLDVRAVFQDAIACEQGFNQDDILNKALYLDCKIQLPDWYLTKTDRASMANSLEMRNPFLDKALAEFAFSIPGRYKIKDGQNKYLLKKLASNYVPRTVIYREKRGFGVPLNHWIRGGLKELFFDGLNGEVSRAFFNKDYLMSIWNDHISEKEDNSFKLLRIINFVYFCNSYG